MLIKKTSYEKDAVLKSEINLAYSISDEENIDYVITQTDEEGYKTNYYYDVAKRLVKLETTPDNQKIITTRMTYDYLGNKTSSINALGNKTTFLYDELGRLVKKVNPLGQEIKYQYSSIGKVLQEEAGGRITKNTYNEKGELKEEKVYEKGSNYFLYTQFTYDALGNILTLKKGDGTGQGKSILAEENYEYNVMNQVTSIKKQIDETKTTLTEISYDKVGNKTSTKEYINDSEFILSTYSYDYAGRLTKETGNYKGSYETQYEYDDLGNLITKTESDEITNYSYNYKNQLIKMSEPYKEGLSQITTYSYDKKGNSILTKNNIQGVDAVTTYTYDGLSRLIAITNPLGYTSNIQYDDLGNKIKEVDARYTDQAIETAKGLEYEYDKLNRLVKVIDNNGIDKQVVSYKEYDQRGNVTKDVLAKGYDKASAGNSIGTVYTYDIYDRVISETIAQTMYENGINGTNVTTNTYTYDGLSNLVVQEDYQGNKTTYKYDQAGKLIEATDPLGQKETYLFDLTGKINLTVINKVGDTKTVENNIYLKPIKVTKEDQTFETYDYNSKGELIKQTDSLGGVTTYQYDQAGNLLQFMQFIGQDNNNKYYKLLKMDYDERGNLLSKETFDHRELLNGASSYALSMNDKLVYTYDIAGRLTKQSEPLGKDTTFNYDKVGNLITKTTKKSDQESKIQRYEYDHRNNLISEGTLIDTNDIDNESLKGAIYDNAYPTKIISKTKYTYDRDGSLSSTTDPNGNVTTYTYNYDKQIVEVKDPLGGTTANKYDKASRLVEKTDKNEGLTHIEYDALGRILRTKETATTNEEAITRYIYDAMGNLIKVISPNDYEIDKEGNPMDMKGTTYVYDNMQRKIMTKSKDGKIIEVIKYDNLGRVEKKVDGINYTGDIASSKGTTFIYDAVGQVLKSTDALGHETSYQYDALGNLLQKTDALGNKTIYAYNPDKTLKQVTNADGGFITYAYDLLGQVKKVVDQRGHTTTYYYNGLGLLQGQVDALGNKTAFKYDKKGNVTEQIDANLSVTKISYSKNDLIIKKRTPIEKDASGNVVYAIETYQYDKMNNLTNQSITGSKETTARDVNYTYYKNNKVKSVTDSAGGQITYSYDKDGNLTETKKVREGNKYDIEQFVYDDENRVIESIKVLDASDIYNSSASVKMKITYEYDQLGKLIKQTDVSGIETNYAYDELGRVKKVVKHQEIKDITISYQYDQVGNKIEEIDPKGIITIYTYDSMNRIKSITKEGTFTYAYDLAGNIIKETNAKGNSITYTYDELGRLKTTTDPFGIIIDVRTYDNKGNVVAVADAKGNSTTFTYDLLGRVIKTRTKEGNETTHKYNAFGELTMQINPLGETTTYGYDAVGRLIKVTDPEGIAVSYGYDKAGNKSYMVDGRGKITKYTYGAFGLLRLVTDAVGKTIKYLYDETGNLAQIEDKKGYHTMFLYNKDHQLIEKMVVETNDHIGYTYDEVGNRITMTDESGETTYTYDAYNRLLTKKNDKGLNLTYTYDVIGNITSLTDSSGRITSYTYDLAQRMETVTYSEGMITYSYDVNGNRKSITYDGGITVTYDYNKDDKLIKLTNVKPDNGVLSTYNYTYDGAGRETSKTDQYGTTKYSYGKAGRVKAVEAPGFITTYAYDQAGNRLSMEQAHLSLQESIA